MKTDSITYRPVCKPTFRATLSALRVSAALIAALVVASGVARAAGAKAKWALPPIPVDVVDGDVRVTGSVAITNTVPVVVQNDMAMQGTVEVVNDVLHAPYSERRVAVVPNGTLQAFLGFDVPDGKRLIVEMISVYAYDESDSNVDITFTKSVRVPTGIDNVTGHLRTQASIFFGHPQFVANELVKLRIDALPGRTDELGVGLVRDSAPGGNCTFEATIHGYLVDL